MSYDYFSPDGNAGRETPSKHWIIEGTMCPIYLEGDLLGCVALCWEYCNIQGSEYEIVDVQYGSLDGVILPEIEDIKTSIQDAMGLANTLIFPNKFHHNDKL
jgi:hypothetical protein